MKHEAVVKVRLTDIAPRLIEAVVDLLAALENADPVLLPEDVRKKTDVLRSCFDSGRGDV